MNKTRLSPFIILIMLFGLLTSCTVNRGFVSSLTRSDIPQVQQFEPLNYVGIIEKGNKISYSDSLTAVVKEMFDIALSEDNTLPIASVIVIEDSIVNNRVQNEIYMLMNYIESDLRVKDIPIPTTIDSILEARSERFGMLAYNWGFTRTGGNYAGQIAKGVAIGILTLGTFYTVPFKNRICSGIIIFDSKYNNLSFVSTASREDNPLKATTHKKQVETMMKKYRQ